MINQNLECASFMDPSGQQFHSELTDYTLYCRSIEKRLVSGGCGQSGSVIKTTGPRTRTSGTRISDLLLKMQLKWSPPFTAPTSTTGNYQSVEDRVGLRVVLLGTRAFIFCLKVHL